LFDDRGCVGNPIARLEAKIRSRLTSSIYLPLAQMRWPLHEQPEAIANLQA